MSERIACRACGGWMYHLASACPHCGAQRTPSPEGVGLASPQRQRPAPLTLSAEEARALLEASAPPKRPPGLAEVAAEVVLPRGGPVDLVLSALAAPVTVLTVVLLGYLLVRERRARREAQLEGVRRLAVPACSLLGAALLAGSGLPWVAWGGLGASFSAWAAREVLRRRRRPAPLA